MADATALSVTSGGAAQVVFAANGARKVFIYTNTSDEVQYVRIGNTNAADGVGIYCAASGGGVVLQNDACPKGQITMIGATTGKKFYAYEG